MVKFRSELADFGSRAGCECLTATEDVELVREPNGAIPLAEFAALRERCPVLREILMPDKVWAEFCDWHMRLDRDLYHESITLLAFRRGLLPKITRPLHDYLISPETGLPRLSKQYASDLREKWMFLDDSLKRNRLLSMFRGKLVEIQFASWLENQSHKILGLEATRPGPDIESVCARGHGHAFEVKFLGLEKGDLLMIQDSLDGHPVCGPISPYQAVDYLLFRVYEAARQLEKSTTKRNAVIVINEMSMFRFCGQLSENWIDWDNPQFMAEDDTWKQLLGQPKKYPGLPLDLCDKIAQLDRVMIFHQNHNFDFRLKGEFNPRRAN
jgi:hypothetical protein